MMAMHDGSIIASCIAAGIHLNPQCNCLPPPTTLLDSLCVCQDAGTSLVIKVQYTGAHYLTSPSMNHNLGILRLSTVYFSFAIKLVPEP